MAMTKKARLALILSLALAWNLTALAWTLFSGKTIPSKTGELVERSDSPRVYWAMVCIHTAAGVAIGAWLHRVRRADSKGDGR